MKTRCMHILRYKVRNYKNETKKCSRHEISRIWVTKCHENASRNVTKMCQKDIKTISRDTKTETKKCHKHI